MIGLCLANPVACTAIVGVTACTIYEPCRTTTVAILEQCAQQIQEILPNTADEEKVADENGEIPLTCSEIKKICIEKCSDEALPSGDHGFRFWNCVNQCLEDSGC